ncbi:MAG: hypothetical protein KJZ87_23775, partial [Thermoguttaceae bacterium]|nr:hypothetical protein [Thermoguttaceae bacterium]
MATRSTLALGLILVSRLAWAVEPAGTVSRSDPAATHEVVSDEPYYKVHPAQGHPAEGNFAVGTKVRLLQEAGSYVFVRSESGIQA